MYRWATIVTLSLALIGVSVWGFQQNKEKNAVTLHSENQYQRSFHELSYHMDTLHDKIGTTLVMNSKEQISPQMIDIWRLTSQAQGNVGQLPLGLLPFNKTEEFLHDIGDFSYRTSARDLDKEPLSDKELKTLKNLHKQSQEINGEIKNVQNVVLEKNLKWVDVDRALASGDEPKDNTITDGFRTVEKKMDGYEEANTDLSLATATQKHDFKNVTGTKISKQEALKKAQNLLNTTDNKNTKIQKSGKGADVKAYNLILEDKNRVAHLDLTEKGGHPLSLLIERPMKEQKISLNQAEEIAEKFLKQNKFKNMEVFTAREYDTSGVFSFLYKQDGVRIYSDSIEVKVGLDNGEVLGLTSRNYLMNHKERKIPKPKINKKEAQNKVNEDVKIEQTYQAIIDNEFGEEILVYEFIGTMNNHTYRIFVNAESGKEEKIEKLTNSISGL